jgi:hypothetical protein
MHNVNFGFIPLADVQSPLSPTCREDPLGLPSAAWALANDDSNRMYPIHHPSRQLVGKTRWVFRQPHGLSLTMIPTGCIQSTPSPTCREDPLGLPSAAWPLVNDDPNRMCPIQILIQ